MSLPRTGDTVPAASLFRPADGVDVLAGGIVVAGGVYYVLRQPERRYPSRVG